MAEVWCGVLWLSGGLPSRYADMKAVIFPGQGSQYAGMGKDLCDAYPCARRIFSRADDILGYSLSEKCASGSPEELQNTSLQQLAILAVSLAAFEVFKEKNIVVDYCSGLSLGEYSCLYCAGVLPLQDVLFLVKERASAMQKAAQQNPSRMFAVMGKQEEELRAHQDMGYYVANVNSGSQIVISLAAADKEHIKSALEKSGAKVIELNVNGGFHSPFMEPAREHLAGVIDGLNFSHASIPIVSNVDAKAYTDKEIIKRNLLNQLTHTVLWKKCMENMAASGVNLFFEVGPSKVLKGLARKINSQLTVVSFGTCQDADAAGV